MASEYCVYKSTNTIPDYDIFVSSDVLGEQIYYNRNCYYLRDFILQSTLCDRYNCYEVVQLRVEDVKILSVELARYMTANNLSSKEVGKLVKFLGILVEIPADMEFKYYIEYCD